jgi:hypothetical protein
MHAMMRAALRSFMSIQHSQLLAAQVTPGRIIASAWRAGRTRYEPVGRADL